MPPKAELDNASAYPAFYYAKHLASGLAGYDDETILINSDSLKAMMPSFIGKPVVVYHKDINLNNLEEKDGTVIESFYNELDGCAWVKMLIETDGAREAISKGWSVSNCYQPTKWDGAGKHHNVDYNRSITNGIFKHLAIVPNPRYEEAKIYTPDEFKNYQESKRKELTELQNSKGAKKMFKFFKNSRQEVKEMDEADTIEYLDKDGNTVIKTIDEMKNALEKKEAKPARKHLVNGKELTTEELVASYEKLNGKACMNDDPEDTDDDADDEMENEKKAKAKAEKEKAAMEAKEKEAKEKENALAEKKKGLKHFSELMNASANPSLLVTPLESVSDKVARGSALYGSGK